MQANGVAILPSSLRDLRAVHALEKACFGAEAWGFADLFFLFTTVGAVRLKAVNLAPPVVIPDVSACRAGEGASRRRLGDVIGFVAGEPRPAQGLAWIATIGVHPDHRRRGIGARLMAECEACLKEPRLRLTVRASNADAIRLYRRLGYGEVGVWPRYYAGSEDGLVMEKIR